MHQLCSIYKPPGLTPFEAIKQFRLVHPEYNTVKIGYAGRLDPLAHGVLLLMIGDETKNRDRYLSLPKSYKFEVVFGLQTDTYDILGLLTDIKSKQIPKNVNIFVNTFVKKSLGKHIQTYPPYSSKAVNGKPLFWWAKNNRLTEITVPTRQIEIYTFSIVSIDEITCDALKKRVYKGINSVSGDFRQKEILLRWDTYFSQSRTKKLPVIKFNITCSSGTYVRELVNQMGNELTCGAIAIDILRTAVGEYIIESAQRI